ncbi:endonuclease V [Deinococcus hohokamensis]|uniref:Endonuclease V n=1 Tax=Deinococcus hohokamensis TaxID=309883 RepID=A0ABV9I9P4_9DEIO
MAGGWGRLSGRTFSWSRPLLLALDVHYRDDHATAAGVLFQDWSDCHPAKTLVRTARPVHPYIPGQFYLRELPGLRRVIDDVKGETHLIVVDGYVTLGKEGRPGLGHHLFEALDGRIPVVGVAKSPFPGTPPASRLLRGQSLTPLYITAAGLTLEEAKAGVARMAGPHRVPTLLRAVDRLCRTARSDES